MRTYKGIPLLAISAASGTGKTTLLTKIIPILKNRGINIGCIKHTHHLFDLDRPGKDSYRLKKAGVDQMLLGDAKNWALFGDAQEKENDLEVFLERLDWRPLDLILIEGFKNSAIPHIALYRTEANSKNSQPLINEYTLAVASKTVDGLNHSLPYLNLDNPIEIATFILNRVLKYSSEV